MTRRAAQAAQSGERATASAPPLASQGTSPSRELAAAATAASPALSEQQAALNQRQAELDRLQEDLNKQQEDIHRLRAQFEEQAAAINPEPRSNIPERNVGAGAAALDRTMRGSVSAEEAAEINEKVNSPGYSRLELGWSWASEHPTKSK